LQALTNRFLLSIILRGVGAYETLFPNITLPLFHGSLLFKV
jgi:hypothetical protein